MSAMSKLKYYLIAVIGWFGYAILLHYFWAHYSANHPFLDWATSTLIPDHISIYHILLYSSDISINLLLVFPFALLLSYLLPSKAWTYICLAVFLVFVREYQNVWSNYETFLSFATDPRAYIGIAMTIGILPVTYFMAVGLRARNAV